MTAPRPKDNSIIEIRRDENVKRIRVKLTLLKQKMGAFDPSTAYGRAMAWLHDKYVQELKIWLED